MTGAFEPTDVVADRLAEKDPAEDASPAIVLAVHADARADEFEIEGLGMTVEEAAPEWPHGGVHDDYVSAEDSVVTVAYIEAVDRVLGGGFVQMDIDTLRRNVENSDRLNAYTFHALRLRKESGTAFEGMVDDG